MRLEAIEEDHKFVPQNAITTFTAEEKAYFPSIPGYGWTQLLDQFNAQINKGRDSKTFRVFIKAPGGSTFWLLKHLETSSINHEVYVSRKQLEAADPFVLSEICRYPSVVFEFPGTLTELHDLVDCVILMPENAQVLLDSVHGWLPTNKPIIAWDNGRVLSGLGGRYFLNSKVWVKS